MAKYGIDLPPSTFPTSRERGDDREYLLNSPMQHALSELARRSGVSLPAFVEMVRGQTSDDYRPNKNLVPSVLKKMCKGYKRLNELLTIAQEGVEVRLRKEPPRQQFRPPNHGSAKERLNVLRKNIRKEQDAWRCLVLDSDLLEQWHEVIISPFGVVDKGGEDVSMSGGTIHDHSYPEDDSINDYTDPTSIIKTEYHHCDAVASETLRAKREHPEVEVEIMAGDVASAFHNISIHSKSVYLFAGQIEEENVIIIELSAHFGWIGSPGFYEIVGGAVSHVHGCHYNDANPTGFFNYHWVDDHINVAANVGTTLNDMNRSLRFAMEAILRAERIDDEKFTPWARRQRVLGLEFDSTAELVRMPQTKIDKTRRIIVAAYAVTVLSRKAYLSLLGSLRHVATCIRAARPFLQRLGIRERHSHRFQSVTVFDEMKQDLL